METADILDRLVAFPSVAGSPNAAIVEWIHDYARRCGAAVTVVPGPEGDRSNLLATVGPADVPGLILSGHTDVVPAGEDTWTSPPFRLRRDGDRLYGRGTTDMKGFLACALAALPALAARPLARPIHLAFSYDEEIGCRGVRHLIAALPGLCATPEGCIVGEPSGLRAVRAHKGKAAARIEVRGRSGHSSQPDRGLNAIHAMAEVIAEAVRTASALANAPLDADFDPPCSTLQIGTITGGQAVNLIPELCVAEVEARAIAGVDPAELLARLRLALDRLSGRGFANRFDIVSEYPALALAADAPLARLVEDLTAIPSLAAVSYGTEAGLYQAAGIDSIICGPGDIGRAHKANEYIALDELAACRGMIETLGERLRA